MDADERGLENSRNPIEWKPTADMYRMDTPEGMEAYEANFQMKIEPRVACEPRPLQGHNSSLRDEHLQFASLTQDSSPGLGPRCQPQPAQRPRASGAPASESLDADTVVGSVLQTEPYANLCPSTRKSRVDGPVWDEVGYPGRG
jgi:hypothetical protein